MGTLLVVGFLLYLHYSNNTINACKATEWGGTENAWNPSLEELTNSLKTSVIILFNLTLYNNTACSAILLEVVNCRGEKLNISGRRLSISTC